MHTENILFMSLLPLLLMHQMKKVTMTIKNKMMKEMVMKLVRKGQEMIIKRRKMLMKKREMNITVKVMMQMS